METGGFDSLIKKESGHFTSNYVCVIAIDDGRYFIDYHYSDNPVKYGVGRLFSHSWVKGVNYEDGKYIQGGKERLSLEALYDCESKEDAIQKFKLVLDAYRQKYGDRVMTNKSLREKSSVAIIKVAKGELHIPVFKQIAVTPDESRFSSDGS
ncbi:MAG: hypothetical protein J6Y69_02165 [Treponema sp.]|nr:hypothetical protein [Treponema sp.]